MLIAGLFLVAYPVCFLIIPRTIFLASWYLLQLNCFQTSKVLLNGSGTPYIDQADLELGVGPSCLPHIYPPSVRIAGLSPALKVAF